LLIEKKPAGCRSTGGVACRTKKGKWGNAVETAEWGKYMGGAIKKKKPLLPIVP